MSKFVIAKKKVVILEPVSSGEDSERKFFNDSGWWTEAVVKTGNAYWD